MTWTCTERTQFLYSTHSLVDDSSSTVGCLCNSCAEEISIASECTVMFGTVFDKQKSMDWPS